MTKTNKIIISAIMVVILLGLYITIDRSHKATATYSDQKISTTTASGSNSKVGASGSGTYTIEQVPLGEGSGVPQPIPDLDRPVTKYPGITITPEALAGAIPRIQSVQAGLKKNPADFNSWLNLGIFQKSAGDYEGAVLSWQYASRLAPTSYIPLGNLGNIYGSFMNDGLKAEQYYKQAISKDSTQENLYTQLAELYKYILKDPVKEKSIIDQGLSNIPNDPNLLQMKSSL